jgi:hypothetical protein
MDSSILLSRDALRGALFAAIGAGAVYRGIGYGVGNSNAMGAGYLPVLVGGLLILLGLSDVVRSAARGGGVHMPAIQPWPVLCLACGVVGFGLLIDDGGLLPAIAVLVGFAFLARRRFKSLEALIIFALLAALSSALFVFGLGSPVSYLLPH